MARKHWIYGSLLLLIFGCKLESKDSQYANQADLSLQAEKKPESLVNPEGKTLESRFHLPEGYERLKVVENSFAHYLRHLKLKGHGGSVSYFDGRKKTNRGVYEAVVDLPIGKRDLHQCADAVMRLWAEHHFEQKDFDKIHFNFTNGFRVEYNEWRKGKRIVVKGNRSYWSPSASPSDSYQSFWKYMEIIFSYAGTLSLEKELKAVSVKDMQIGDVFIQGGSPGHAIIVVDMAEHTESGKKIFMLAQSYMPAQETQILKNPHDESISPWYTLDFGENLYTPEWNFRAADLKRFVDW
ncbi:MAG: DUF4846 domain-containing protein [Bacteroidota bacterium]